MANQDISFENTGQVIDPELEVSAKEFHEPDEHQKELLAFIISHTDRWRDHRNQNNLDNWQEYERIFFGKWEASDKTRDSERSRIISPATQQAVETRHAEVMEAIFGQGNFFDIKDDLKDVDGTAVDVEKLKAQLNEDFSRDKIRKSIDQIGLMASIYGTGIGEVIIGDETAYYPASQPMPGPPQMPGMPPVQSNQIAYGVKEEKRFYVRINPVNPKNFLFDPNGTSVDDCMGVAIERYVSVHKIAAGIKSEKYLNVDIDTTYTNDQLEASQEKTTFQDEKVLLLTYYGLVPREHLAKDGEEVVELDDEAEYSDMVEAIVVIANGNLLLKAEESPYMMKDRPVISYQDDTVPNRLLGRGVVEKAYNMQKAVDGSMRSHMDALALTVAPMVGLDATRLPRGAKFEVKPGKAWMFNGNPSEIVYPFKFGTNDGQAMQTSKEFERMLLMATGTVDSAGGVTPTTRDAGGMDMATATLIKKYKRTLVNFQEDFLIPFINKAAWRYMQFSPERYPSMDVKFLPTATLGIIAREYEQKQLAFLIQTLGANSPITPVLMGGILKNSGLSNREEMLEQMMKLSQPNPEQQKMQQEQMQMEMAMKQAQIQELQGKAQKLAVDTQLAPQVANSEVAKIQAQMQLEQMNAENNMRQEVARSTNDVTIEREQARGDIQVKQYEADLKANNEAMKLEFERWKAELGAANDMAKVEIERYKADLSAQTALAIAQMQSLPKVEAKDPTINKM